MRRFKDITGQKFGRLTAIKYLHNTEANKAVWLCKCDCGNFVEVVGSNLRSGMTNSCGCYKKDMHPIEHGMSNTRIHKTWQNMKTRCYNKNYIQYKDYGGRGVKVCDEWRNSFKAFYAWAMSHGYEDTLTIDRIDNNGNYTPYNCRWVTTKQQNRNTRKTRKYAINGVTKCLKDWCRFYNIRYSTVLDRLNKLNWTIENALELTNGEEVKAC